MNFTFLSLRVIHFSNLFIIQSDSVIPLANNSWCVILIVNYEYYNQFVL